MLYGRVEYGVGSGEITERPTDPRSRHGFRSDRAVKANPATLIFRYTPELSPGSLDPTSHRFHSVSGESSHIEKMNYFFSMALLITAKY